VAALPSRVLAHLLAHLPARMLAPVPAHRACPPCRPFHRPHRWALLVVLV